VLRWQLLAALVLAMVVVVGLRRNSRTVRTIAAQSNDRAGPATPAGVATVTGTHTPAIGGIMRLSARNQLAGTVAAIDVGAVMAIVKVDLPGGQQITASITKEAVEQLGVTVGSAVTAIIKSTEVMLGVE
jgi:molybdopterin-binding protein